MRDHRVLKRREQDCHSPQPRARRTSLKLTSCSPAASDSERTPTTAAHSPPDSMHGQRHRSSEATFAARRISRTGTPSTSSDATGPRIVISGEPNFRCNPSSKVPHNTTESYQGRAPVGRSSRLITTDSQTSSTAGVRRIVTNSREIEIEPPGTSQLRGSSASHLRFSMCTASSCTPIWWAAWTIARSRIEGEALSSHERTYLSVRRPGEGEDAADSKF